MSKVRLLINKNPLFYAFLFPLVCDAGFTLFGQDATYWQDYKTVNEMAPIYILLATSPWLYVSFEVFWFVFVYLLVKKLKHPLNLILTMVFIVGHTFGSANWLKYILSKLLSSSTYFMQIMIKNGFMDPIQFALTVIWTIIILYFLVIGIWTSYFINIYFKNSAQ